jgi:hypothetical protein
MLQASEFLVRMSVPMQKLHSFLASCMHTRYTVELPDGPPLTLTIGTHSPDVDRLLRHSHASTYAYMTAYNPQSTSLLPADNQQRHLSLCHDLQQRNISFLLGSAIPITGAWEPEVCVFAFNMSRTVVLDLCQHYDQDGAIVGDWGSAPKLLFTNPQLRADFLNLLHSCVLD